MMSRPSEFIKNECAVICAALTTLLIIAAVADRSPALPPPGLPNPNLPCDRTRKVFTDLRGEFAHGPTGVNYTQDSHCEWLIKARNESQFITLKFHSMGTECSYDYIYVYDGDSFNSTLLGSFSGKTEPQRLVASSGSMLILLYSDTNYVLEGFRASYFASNCLNNCHNHGKCVGHKCVCHGEWVGPDCEDVACPENCGERFGRGKCIKGMCKCNTNYSGRLCDLYIDPEGGNWRWLATDAEGMTARAAHTAVYIEEQDSLYVFGGYDLNSVLDSLQIYRFKKSQWEGEWGLSLQNRNRYQPQKPDNILLKAVLFNEDEEEAGRWGLKNGGSIFRNVLYTLAEANSQPRKQRSTANITQDEIAEIFDDILENVTDSRPEARYGHAAEKVPGGFVIYGGKLPNGDLSNELWLYNITDNGGQWILRATNSTLIPPSLARHTLTLGGDFLYIFGGSLSNGEFSSRIFRIKLLKEHNKEQWEEVNPRGGKSLDVRLVAHSTTYYRYTNSLIVYGGIMASMARFSKLSDRIFAFQLDSKHWTEILYPRTPLRDAYIPRERAFHSASIAGNYLIVFGGYTHRHNKEEICYDNQMYLYHLGCHTWINQDVLGPAGGYQYPKRQGVFAHAAAIRMNNTLVITGGYHGNVNADMFAYELPRMFRVSNPDLYNPEQSCKFHTTVLACLSDPECGWCSADSSCYGRTIGANCTTNLQTTRCPGICPSLGDCHSCLVHGTPWSTNSKVHSISSKLGLNQCSWCVQNARCHHKDDNYGVCGEDTPSQVPGWWGEKGTEIRSPSQCTELDRRPGLTYIKYHHPINWTMPDVVSLVNATMVDFISPGPTTHTEHAFNGEMIARLLGFVRPPKNLKASDEELRICSSYSEAVFRTGLGLSLEAAEIVSNKSTQESACYPLEWPSLSEKFLVDFQAKRKVGIGSYNNQYEQSKMELQHLNHGNWKAFTFEYLEPYSNGACSEYTNCLQCLSDSLCGWCDLNSKCLPRTVNETIECSDDIGWKFITIQPAQCGNCSNYITCEHCINTGMCEWWAEDARCARSGRSSNAVRSRDKCPTPCMERKSCSDCLDEKGRCVWCEAKSQCFNFAVYTSEYQFGICREWLDQSVPISTVHTDTDNAVAHLPKIQQCKSCIQHRNCSSCLRTLSCGWCFDRDNPIDGICMQGDFSRSVHDCGAALNTSSEEAEWAYAQCPDVDECGLGLHNCHKEAKCTNTHGSYNCHCRRGYIGDGFISCIKTCNETCVHGNCSGSPEYICKCDLGWTGADCSKNCGCNNHSTCEEQIGKCDECQNWTEGETCNRCRPGSYGNATSGEGCQPCECNGHGNHDLGICDLQTGECFCKDNTGGLKCEICNPEYYGDPREGGQCYFQCESRGMLTSIGKQGIGSYQSYKNPWGGSEVRECLWLITPHAKTGTTLQDSLIQIDIKKSDINVICDENAVYIYDSLPDLTGNTQQSQLLAVLCSPESSPQTIEARTGHITVHYKQGGEGHGFNALYHVRSCSSGTCLPPHVCDEKNQCICRSGFIGSHCEVEVCPNNCTARERRGICHKAYGRCICSDGYGGNDCSINIKPHQLQVKELFNTRRLAAPFDHYQKTIPRFGHSLHADKRGSLWMFGGYSLSNGALNDIRQFDTKNGTWVQVTVDSTTEAKMPRGRYFHAADISFSKQAIYIYGGITSAGKGQPNIILGDFWEFKIQNQQWDEVEMDKNKQPPALAGHTLTLIKRDDRETLLLIGGVDIENSRELHMWEFDLESTQWEKINTPGVPIVSLYGHTSVYHAASKVIYVFGGLSNAPKSKLYALNVQKMIWTELPPFSDVNEPHEVLPRNRFFHSAIATDNYMVIYGGRSVPYNASDILLAYVYDCNQWIRLTEDVSIVGNLPSVSYAEAMTIDPDSKLVYVVGGWDGSSQSQVIQLALPEDICQLWSSGKISCRSYKGCSFCTVKPIEDFTSRCYTSGQPNVCESYNGTSIYNSGIQCDDKWISLRNCSLFETCTSCMSFWPTHTEDTPVCQWCESCDNKGVCMPAGNECPADIKQCNKETTIGLLSQCPSLSCSELSCDQCIANENCFWTKTISSSLKTDLTNCINKENINPNEVAILTSCQAPCHTFTNCSSCLYDETVETNHDTPKYCRWSTSLNACITDNYQPLYCAGGVCGLVLDYDEIAHCPEPCHAYTQCSSCLRHAHCGWCSRDGEDGDGVCTEGSLESFSEYPASSTCDIIYASRKNITELEPTDKFTWNYVHCPPENECENNHHNCDPKSEKCIDNVNGYQCICGVGYKAKDTDCVPICAQGCVRGTCIEPNICECDFGYVGANCSIQCQCNGHSNCVGPDKLDECLQCHNNTLGAQCDKCKPLFVGNPKNNGACVPCSTYCNGHSDVCVAQDAEPPVKNMTKAELETYLTEGPVSDAICLKCANKTDGNQCEGCIIGNFRGSDNHQDPCRPCECHGHGDICDPVSGEKCNCGNNTESDPTCSASSSKNSAQLCWRVQCSKCRDSYAGNPTEGHQCYKQITVESRMCFDAKPIEECKVKPQPLRPGQTVFFVIQPRFMNVDIRIIIDVTQGELDVFMSPQDDSFIIHTNQSNGHHMLLLDNRYRWVTEIDSELSEPLNIAQTKYEYENQTLDSNDEKLFWTPHIHDCTSLGGTGFFVKDQRARDLSTYITLNQCNTLLRLFGLRNRLVLTLPQNAHNLSATRFFIALKASTGSDHSYGSIVFRQDQLHIDLFVFFSVFFSCFFLFLAICVVAWKAKQAADIRRARRRHVVEMQHMANRPFARVRVLLTPENETPVQTRRRGRSKMSSSSSGLDVKPVAIEPTADNVAAVGTVFISLPGKYKAPVTLALGSSLVVLSRQNPAGVRPFLRRRGSHHANHPPTNN